jgi:hypothetical protein
MDLSLSWYRINSKLWVLYTTKDADALYTRLRSLAGDDGNLFICKLNTADRQGWMKKAFWNWLREHESKE